MGLWKCSVMDEEDKRKEKQREKEKQKTLPRRRSGVSYEFDTSCCFLVYARTVPSSMTTRASCLTSSASCNAFTLQSSAGPCKPYFRLPHLSSSPPGPHSSSHPTTPTANTTGRQKGMGKYGISAPRTNEEYEMTDDSVISKASAKTSSPFCRKLFLFFTASTAALGGILFGYDIGVISGALLQLRRDFQLSCDQQSIVVSFLLLGAIIGALVSGFLVDLLGRWITIVLNGFFFILGSLTIALAQSFTILVIGRLVLGFAISVSSVAECVYISEISPAKRRGQLVSLNEFGITIGLVLSYLINFLYINVAHGWRYMFGLSSVLAVLQILMMLFLPQSPRYLVLKGKEAQAAAVLRRFHSEADMEEEINNIKTTIDQEKMSSWKDLFRSTGNLRKLFFLGFGLVTFQQFTGQPNMLYYAPIVFRVVGFPSDSAAILATLGLGTVKVSVAIVALLCVDHWGRRILLMIGVGTMTISLIILSIGSRLQNNLSSFEVCRNWHDDKIAHDFPPFNSDFNSSSNGSFIHYTMKKRELIPSSVSHIVTSVKFLCDTSITRKKRNENSSPYNNISIIMNQSLNHAGFYNQTIFKNTSRDKEEPTESQSVHIIHVMTLLALMAYVGAYGISFGPISWILLSEIYPPSIRGRAVGVVIIINWTANFIVSSSFLHVIHLITLPWTFLLFAVISSIAFIFIFYCVPETKNKTLEQIARELSTMRRSGCVTTTQQTSSVAEMLLPFHQILSIC
ncbi:solute carrier family 2, facilitated glucose transporter member 10 isoform X2 [Octopus sinensis]|uniref:Solute carrier family 2, facilitated glucose transporter member 10 isoform X2 n=1 Tax=Octopus sinensis TaxID=2607531 RepID=A0A7E6F2D9_9MOLL|nr:solute carrier family 2, facilitated glucose transporter member 10 isoform X2 [Octopus sinensis]